MIKAMIGTHNKVIDTAPSGQEWPAANPWVDAPDLARIGWDYDPLTNTVTEPPPPPPRLDSRTINLRDFLDRISEAKQDAILALEVTDKIVLRLIRRAGAAPFDLDDPKTVAGVDYLVGLGVIDQADKTALLA